MAWNSTVFDLILDLERITKVRLNNLENYLNNAPENVVEDLKLIKIDNFLKDSIYDYDLIDEVKKRGLIDLMEDDFRLNFQSKISDFSTLEIAEELKNRGLFNMPNNNLHLLNHPIANHNNLN